jgi:hypothetical protein
MAGLTVRSDGLHLRLERDEVAVLRTLALGLASRLEAGSRSADETADENPDHLRAADDAVLARLAPIASHGHPEVAAELRRLLRAGLLGDRAARLAELVADLDRSTADQRDGGSVLVLDRPAADRMLQALNDLRLALGAAVGIEQLDRNELGTDDDRHATLELMDALAWLQEGLIRFLEVGEAGA